MENGRNWLKSNWEMLEDFQSDQQKGIPVPPIQLPPGDAEIIPLPEVDRSKFEAMSLTRSIALRRSFRKFTDQPMSIQELSYLLWATQGVDRVIGDGRATLRTVPSAGARHPFETYLLAHRVLDLQPGCYRYLPVDHQLAKMGPLPPADRLAAACLGQEFVARCCVTFVWSVVPYRTEWRYGPVSPKIIALDAGHLCQNLYLASLEVGCGTCGIGAYDQRGMDSLIGLDGDDELVIYLAPVGKIDLP